MIKMKLQLLCLFVCMTCAGLAQVKEGKITYDMTFTSDNPDMAMAIGAMQGSKMILSFAPGKSRSEVSMGTMGTMVTIADEKAKKTLALVDMMGMKYAIQSDADAADKEPETAEPSYNVEITNETKMIMGYKCTKAIMTSEDAGVITVWFTKEINAYTGGQRYYTSDMPGFPMALSMSQNEMVVDMTAVNVEKKADKALFDMKVPEGYEVKTAEEMQMMGQ
jgi:GLPGLI family protein